MVELNNRAASVESDLFFKIEYSLSWIAVRFVEGIACVCFGGNYYNIIGTPMILIGYK